MPTPPPTSSGRGTSRSKPLPSGPRTWIATPGSRAQSARVPRPSGSMRNASSPGGARQRLIGRGSRRPGASSMKNWPGRPGSSVAALDAQQRVRPEALAAGDLKKLRRIKVLSIGSEPVLLGEAGLCPARARTGDGKTVRKGGGPWGNHGFPHQSLLEAEGVLGARVGDGLDAGGGAGDRRHARNAGGERRLADEVAVRAGRARLLRRVDHEVAAAAADEVDDRGVTAGSLGDLRRHLHVDARVGEGGGRSRRRDEPEAEPRQRGGDRDDRALVGVTHGDEHRARPRQRPSRGSLRLAERAGEVVGGGHHLARGAHLRAEHGVGAGEARERQDGRLHGHVAGAPSRRAARATASDAPAISRQAASTRLTPVALLANGTVRDARGFASSTEIFAVDERQLDVDEARSLRAPARAGRRAPRRPRPVPRRATAPAARTTSRRSGRRPPRRAPSPPPRTCPARRRARRRRSPGRLPGSGRRASGRAVRPRTPRRTCSGR